VQKFSIMEMQLYGVMVGLIKFANK